MYPFRQRFTSIIDTIKLIKPNYEPVDLEWIYKLYNLISKIISLVFVLGSIILLYYFYIYVFENNNR